MSSYYKNELCPQCKYEHDLVMIDLGQQGYIVRCEETKTEWTERVFKEVLDQAIEELGEIDD